MSKTLTYTSFAVASLLVILAFITAKSYSQLAIAVILFPALTYFALKIFPRKTFSAPKITIKLPSRPVQRTHEIKRQKVDVVDLDKRTFLKLVGTVGVSFFIFSLLGRRVGDLLFGRPLTPGTISPEDSTGKEAGTAQPIPTSGYSISEIDENTTSYYGFINKDGGWFIMREDSEANSFRYAKGGSEFPKNWASRKNLKYDYYYNLF